MLTFIATAACTLGSPFALAGEDDWRGWRGTHGAAVANGAPPTEWSEEKNLRWKVSIPGKGLSSPVVTGGVIYLTSAVPTGKAAAPVAPPIEPQPDPNATPPERGAGRGGRGGRGGGMRMTPPVEHAFRVFAIDHTTGAVRWERTATTLTPHEGTHGDGSFASPTMVTDGARVYASFGSFGLFAYDLKGELVWQKDLGDMSIQGSFGEGISPLLAGGNLVVLWAHNGDSFLVALDAKTGEERWRQAREPGTGWATPVVVATATGEQVIIAGATTQAYDAKSGELRWFHGGDGRPKPPAADAEGAGGRGAMMMGGPIASPVIAGGHVYFSTGGRRGALCALNVEAKPDVDGQTERVVWTHEGDTPNIPSPLVVDGVLYTLKGNSGVLAALDAKTGAPLYVGQRLQAMADAYASPVAAGGHLYFSGRDGTFEVVKTGPEFVSVAVNRLDDKFDASPAVIGDTLVLRGMNHLYCVAAGAK